MNAGAVLAEGVRAGAYPGGQVAVARGDRTETWVAGRLAGPGSPAVDEGTVYDLASLTKPLVTAVLLFRAVEAGACRLEDPIRRFVPEAPAVSLLDLLEHRSGLPAHLRLDRRLPPDIRPGSRAAFDHVVRDAARTALEAPPGTRAVYSDLGFILLGAALEVMGGSLPGQLRALGCDGLLMVDRRDGDVPPPLPFAPTEGDLRGEVHDDNARAMGGVAGHAGTFGAAGAVLAAARGLVDAYHGGAGPLTPSSVRRMWAPSPVAGSTRTAGWDRPSPGRSSAGRAFPPSSVGHLGFTGTSLWIEPERGLIVVFLTNRVWPRRDNEAIREVRPALHDAAWARFVGPPAAPLG